MSMASIRKEIAIAAPADLVWAAVRDVGAVHHRLAPGFVTDVQLEDDARVVSFANGLTVRELLVDIDDASRRLAYAATGGRARHHHASMQVFPDGSGGCRLLWITDILPHAAAGPVGAMVEEGARVMQRTLEGARPLP
jgi:carbon monoxide dehydrogenase subunit G